MKKSKWISTMKNHLFKLLVLVFIASSITSCSRTALVNAFFSKTVELDYKKPVDYKQFNKYEKDALYLVELIRQSYPRLSTKIENYDEESTAFIKSVALIKDDFEFEFELSKFMALLKDGHSHTALTIKEEIYFNLILFKNKDQWVIQTVDKSIDSLVIGSSLVSINGKSIEKIKELINRFECGENEYWTLNSFRYYIRIPKYLEGAGVINKGDDLHLVISKNGIEKALTLKRLPSQKLYKTNRATCRYPFVKKQNDGFYTKIDTLRDYAYLQMNTSLDYVSVKSEIDNYVNPLVRPIALAFMRKEQKEAMNFGLVLQDLFKEIEEKSVKNLIIDLRNNTGGDERLGKQLIWYLTENQEIKGFTLFGHNSKYYRESMKKDYKEFNAIYKKKYQRDMPEGEINETKEFYDEPYFYDIEKAESPYLLDASIPKFKGKIYILIGSNTFSAGQVLATTMYDNKIGTFVGTPTGNQPSCQTGVSIANLPKTKKQIVLSLGYFERPDKTKNKDVALFPHVEIHPSFEKTYLGNIDESFDFIMKEIENENYAQQK